VHVTFTNHRCGRNSLETGQPPLRGEDGLGQDVKAGGADGSRAGQWSFRDQHTWLPETVRERVQASVVLSTRLNLGDQRTGRIAIRQDFSTRELIAQTILGRRASADDPEVQAHVRAALAHLRDQVGLPA